MAFVCASYKLESHPEVTWEPGPWRGTPWESTKGCLAPRPRSSPPLPSMANMTNYDQMWLAHQPV